MSKFTIFGIYIHDRVKTAGICQEIFSEFGCNIKTRLGLHQADDKICSKDGLIILEIVGSIAEIEEMERKLKDIEGIQYQKMVF